MIRFKDKVQHTSGLSGLIDSRDMTPKVQHRPFLSILTGVILIALIGVGTFSAYRYIQTNQASIEVSRLFMRLERTIGYNGFIHNFKNYVLRPDEVRYYEQAKNDLSNARETIVLLTKLSDDLGIANRLDDLTLTIETYGDKLEELARLGSQDMSSRIRDAQVRVSDAEAGAAIQDFEKRVQEILSARQSEYSFFFLLICSAWVALFCGIFAVLFQSNRREKAHATEVDHKNQMLMEAEDLARLGRWHSDLHGSLGVSVSARNILGIETVQPTECPDFALELVHPEDRDKLRLAIQRAADGVGHFSCLHRMIRPDGKTIMVNNIGEAVRAPNGEIKGFNGTIQDMTEFVELESRLRQAEKMEAIGHLAGGIAHDFNNLLAVILGNLELIKETEDRAEIERFRSAAHHATTRGAKLTRDILGFARKSTLQPKNTNLNDLLRESSALWKRTLPANISLETSFVAGPWLVEVDRDLVLNAILNLAVNARDAMPNGGKLTFETANIRTDDQYIDERGEEIEPGRYAMIAVTDTGSGIPTENLKRIFEPFFTTKPVGEGSGVGLAMVIGFMRQSQGTILVYSEVGVGTTFKLYFKASNSQLPEQSLHVESPAGDERGDGACVLVVEDEAAVLTTIEQALTKVGFDVLTARSGDEAKSKWPNAEGFDVLLTDIVMPGRLQGTHLAREMRKVRPELPVVFMSGYPTEAAVHGNGVQPEDGRLMKPVGKSELVAAINKAMRDAAGD